MPAEPMINLVCAANDGYVMPMYVMLYSAMSRMAAGREVHVYVFNSGISDGNLQKIKRLETIFSSVSIEILDPILDRIKALPQVNHLGAETYIRLNVDVALPKSVERILYIDCDMMVCTDLAAVFDLDLKGNIVGAVGDQFIENIAFGIPYLGANSGVDGASAYFNAGILLIDLRRWRDELISDRVLEFTSTHAQSVLNGDQDGLNVVLAERWLPLDDMLNVQVNSLAYVQNQAGKFSQAYVEKIFSIRDRFLEQAKIIHFSGGFKPWSGYGLNKAYVRRYIALVDRSGYYSKLEYSVFWWRGLLKFGAHHLGSIFSNLRLRMTHQ